MNGTKVLCTKCGKEEAEWDFADDQYCQMCFENYCDEEFWKAVDEGWIL